MKKILIIQIAKIGDILQTSHLVDKVKKIHPQSELSFLCNESFQIVARKLKIEKIIGIDTNQLFQVKNGQFMLRNSEYLDDLLNRINQVDFDIIINTNSLHISKNLLEAFQAKEKFGFGSENSTWPNFIHSFIKSRRLGSFNLVDIYRNMYKPKQFTNEFTTKKFPNIQDLKKKNVLFQLGMRSEKRKWPMDYWRKLAIFLLENDVKIQLIGSPEERKTADKFISREIHEIDNLVGETSLDELFEIIKNSDLLITGDTGPQHIAAFYKIPTIAIFTGPAFPAETLGFSPNCRVFTPDPNKFHCYPCNELEKCPYNLQCHFETNPKEIVIFLEGKKSNAHVPIYDAIGQKISQQINSNFNLIKEIYRNFAAKYFFEIDENSPNSNLALINELKTDIAELKREILITDKLLRREINLNQLPQLDYLLPIFLMKKLINYDFAKQVLNFIKISINF